MNARTGLVPDWLERQYSFTRPDRVMTVTEYDERITAALGMLPGTLYLVSRRLLLETCEPPADGVADSLQVSTRELADRVGLAGHAQVVRFLGQQTWFMRRATAAQVVRQANGEVVGRTPTLWAVYGLPPLLPADQVAIHDYLQRHARLGNAEDALAAVLALNDLAVQGWPALRRELFTASADMQISDHPAAQAPQSLLALAQGAIGIPSHRTPMALVQATQTLRANLRGRRTEIPHYLIDHWLPELGPTPFWLLIQVLRECQSSGQANATLRLADSAERIGVSERTVRRLAHDLGGLLDTFGAFAGAIGLRGNHLELNRVLYMPESTPLAPVHEQDILSTEGQNSPSVGSPVGQNSPSVGVQGGQNSPSGVIDSGQISPSANTSGDKSHHRSIGLILGASGASNRLNGSATDKTHLEEKSLNQQSDTEVHLEWADFWKAMQSHGKLQRKRQVREAARQHPALWAAAVLEQMTRGMEDPITLAVDGFDPKTSPHTVPYICLELAHRGPAFTATVLSALAYPDLAWPKDPDLDRCILELRRIGVRAFKEASASLANATIGQLGIRQISDDDVARMRVRQAKVAESSSEVQNDEPMEAATPTALERLWRTVLEQLQMELPRATFDTWLSKTQLIDVTDHAYVVAAPTQYAADWLGNRMSGAVRRILSQVSGVKGCTVEFQVKPSD